MFYDNTRNILGQLKNGELAGLYYIYGQDVNEVEALTKAIVKIATGESDGLSLNRLNGSSLEISELRDMIEMMPMLSEYNCILVNDYNCDLHREDENKDLINALSDIPPRTVVIFNITGFDIKDGKKSVQGKNKKLADFVSRSGICCECGLKDTEYFVRAISSKVSKMGCSISPEAARELAEMCLNDSLVIKNEIEKLCAYAGNREITPDDVHLLTARRSDATVFRLADAVAKLDKKSAFEALDELTEQRVARGAILGSVYSSFIDIYRASCAKRSGRNADNVAEDFKYKWAFKVKNAFRASPGFSLPRLRYCLSVLRDTALSMNSTSCDEKTAIEQAIVKMIATGGSRRKYDRY